MANQTTLVERIEARVQREDSGQIAVGTHVLVDQSTEGSLMWRNGAQVGPKPVPIQLRPRPFPLF
jgi:hypothetical protein